VEKRIHISERALSNARGYQGQAEKAALENEESSFGSFPTHFSIQTKKKSDPGIK
jgi:hypothetical protein